jgi:hypothetical protein
VVSLRNELEGYVGRRHMCSRNQVDDMVKRARGKGCHLEGNQALVLAYYAQRHPQVFAKDAQKAVAKALVDVEWKGFMAELKAFMADLEAKAEEERKAAELKKEMLEDDLKHDERKRELVKANGTADDRKRELRKTEAQKAEQKKQLREASEGALGEELTASGRLPLSDVELAKLQLLKKGFANRS